MYYEAQIKALYKRQFCDTMVALLVSMFFVGLGGIFTHWFFSSFWQMIYP